MDHADHRVAHGSADDQALLTRLLAVAPHKVQGEQAALRPSPWAHAPKFTSATARRQSDRFDALLLRWAQICGGAALLLCAFWLFNGPLYDALLAPREQPNRPASVPALNTLASPAQSQPVLSAPPVSMAAERAVVTSTPPLAVPTTLAPEAAPRSAPVAPDALNAGAAAEPPPPDPAPAPQAANPVVEPISFPSFRAESEPPLWVQVPNAGIDTPVIYMYHENGRWSEVDYAAGYLYGSGDPGEPGNVVIGGHAGLRGGVFMHLPRVKPGDDILVYTVSHRFVYRVSETKIVWPDQIEVFDAYATATLTLFSCANWDTQRLVVVADFISGEPHPELQPLDG